MIVGIVLLVVSGLLSSLFYSKKKYIWFLLCLIFALCCFLGFTADITNILLHIFLLRIIYILLIADIFRTAITIFCIAITNIFLISHAVAAFLARG